MPEGLTPEEQRQYEIDEAKYKIRKNLLALGNLIGREATQEFVKEDYPFLPF